MDSPQTPQDAYKFALTRFFNDSASECFNHCVKDYESKELSLTEKKCVNTCYKKQMIRIEEVAAQMVNK